MTTKETAAKILREYLARGYPIHFQGPKEERLENGVIIRHGFKEKDKGQQARGKSEGGKNHARQAEA